MPDSSSKSKRFLGATQTLTFLNCTKIDAFLKAVNNNKQDDYFNNNNNYYIVDNDKQNAWYYKHS